MENEGPGDWPSDGYPDGGDADLSGSDDSGLSDELGYDVGDSGDTTDPGDPSDSGDSPDGYDDSSVDSDGADGSEPGDDGLGDTDLGDDPGVHDAPVNDDTSPDVADAPIGTDPDANPLADDESWSTDPFPQALEMDQPPEPVDGMPWSDPDLLGPTDGGEPLGNPAETDAGSPPVDDLYAYDGSQPPEDGTNSWGSLVNSEDPATSSLARFWAPGS